MAVSAESTEDATSVVSNALEATVVAQPAQIETPPVPTRVGRYEVRDTIGVGAMGMVLRAHDPTLDRIVAVKVLRTRTSTDHGDETRMQREARALAKLSHPNVIDVYDVGTVHGRVFIAMEFVDGDTLGGWLSTTPSPDAVIDAFVQAGQGLAAAHDVGLVHRDFKPANVLRGRDGRVRVVDFGLAAPPRDSSVDPTLGSLDDDLVDLRVTATGVVMGTPAYMAPEAHCGEFVDARSDQFSFCVALFEALWGKRPFLGPRPKDIAVQASRGDIHFPSGTDVPQRLRQIVVRGLAASPEDRWPSMHALLEQLRPTPKARWPWLLAGAVGLAAVPVTMAWLPESRLLDCETIAPEVESLWDEDARRRVHAAFDESGSSSVEQTWPWVDEKLTEHTRALADARRAACEARADPQRSADLLDREVRCLRRLQSTLAGVVSVLEHADVGTVRNAVRVVGDLSLLACEDEALAAELTPPPPEIAAAVDQADEDMAQGWAEVRAGHYERATTLARELVERAESIGYTPLLAEARFLLASSLVEHGDYEAAEREMNDALMVAQEAGHDVIVARVSTQMIFLVGNHLRRPDDAEQWVRHAKAAVERLADPAKAEAALDSTLGNFHWMKGDFERAREHFERSAVAHEQLRGRLDGLTIITRSNLGMVYLELGEPTKAKTLVEAVLADRIEVYGPDHPEVSTTYANLANIEQALGEFDAAVDYTKRALDGLAATVGKTHPHYPQLLMNLANNRFLQGHYEEAIEIYGECKTLMAQVLGPRSFLVGRTLNNLGAALHHVGRNEEARTALVQSKDILEEHLSEGHPELAGLVGNIANVDRVEGRLDQALAGATEAIEMFESSAGPEHPEIISLLSGRSEIYREMKRNDDALGDLRRALAIAQKSDAQVRDDADIHYNIAQTLWSMDRRAEAVEHMLEAKANVDRSPGRTNDLPEKIDRWLDEHPLD